MPNKWVYKPGIFCQGLPDLELFTESEMNDNEKAAIAAGLAETCEEHRGNSYCRKLPDMHDPANLWRALENLEEWHAYGRKDVGSSWYLERGDYRIEGRTLFAALVELYNAEHSG